MLTPTYGSINGEATPLLTRSCITRPRTLNVEIRTPECPPVHLEMRRVTPDRRFPPLNMYQPFPNCFPGLFVCHRPSACKIRTFFR